MLLTRAYSKGRNNFKDLISNQLADKDLLLFMHNAYE